MTGSYLPFVLVKQAADAHRNIYIEIETAVSRTVYIAERAMITFIISEVPADGPSTKESRK